MILGDSAIGLASVTLLLINLNGNLQIWHLYLLVTLISPFGQLQSLAAETIVKNLVPQQNFGRATGLSSLIGYAPQIVAPALAGLLYPPKI